MSTRPHMAIVAPRFPDGPTVGGAETLLKQQALRLVAAGYPVTFLTTCARNHFTWENELPPGRREVDGVPVHFFPVDDDRDIEAFLRVQDAISRGRTVSDADESVWLRNNVNSRALYQHLNEASPAYERILVGPYLFGLTHAVATAHPSSTLLVPCLHDEAFAYLRAFAAMFQSVRGCLFNSVAEKRLAKRLYELPEERLRVVGMGMDPFVSDPGRTARRKGIEAPYIVYSGRREPLKGTPLLMDYFAAFRRRTGQDVRLVLTGTGPVDVPGDMRPYVIDLGFVSEEDKHDAMAGALAFCHPSVNESFGIVLLEAWLAGTPGLVHARSEVLKQHCKDSHGGLWFRNYPDFEVALLMLLENRALRDAMGASGKQYVREVYGWEAIEKRLVDALATV